LCLGEKSSLGFLSPDCGKIEMIANLLLTLAGYLSIGVLAAIGLHAKGLRTIDPSVAGAGAFFRVLVTPGLIALWPLMLYRWAQATRGEDPAPLPESFVSAKGLRRTHGFWIQLVAILIPLAAGAALATRRPEFPRPEPGFPKVGSEVAALPDVLEKRPGFFSDALPIDAMFRGDASGARQIELSVRDDLPAPKAALFWKSQGAASDKDGLSGAAFLGLIRGPGTHRFRLPAGVDPAAGTFFVYSLGHGEMMGSSKRG
jgi:hypothetical protein